jgi:hypothetical protein
MYSSSERIHRCAGVGSECLLETTSCKCKILSLLHHWQEYKVDITAHLFVYLLVGFGFDDVFTGSMDLSIFGTAMLYSIIIIIII